MVYSKLIKKSNNNHLLAMAYTCLVTTFPYNVKQTIEYARVNKFSAIAISAVSYGFADRELLKSPLKHKHVPFSRSDLILDPNNWSRRVVLMLSDPYGIDFKDKRVRHAKESLLSQELDNANFLQCSGYVMLRLNYGSCVANLARILASKVKCLILVNVKLASKDDEDTWLWWNQLRTCANFSGKMKAVLEISSNKLPNEEHINRWIGEPLEGIELPANLFIRNKSNYPVLPRNIQQLLSRFLENGNINFFVSTSFDENLQYHSEYLEILKSKFDKTKNNMFHSVADTLQLPLQPLYDNLDTYTYQVFEKDPLKYMKYQEAVAAALKDMEGGSEKIIMVLGAGRGPLVRAVLNASKETKCPVKIYVIEKNSSAINTLHAHVRETWSDSSTSIQIINQDMRDFNPPIKADIIVSELLGSFGDNELSPECLDCATRLLKDTGISIPYKSTSYVNPIMSTKLLESVRNLPPQLNQSEVCPYTTKAQCMYVVFLNNVYHIDEPQPLFEFTHPNRECPVNNSRFAEVSFKATADCVLTGFAGYFDADLYKDIKISIHPTEHTVGMSSWFPMFIPIIEPQFVKAGETISALFWRNVGSHAVWYEWMTLSPQHSLRHNPDGQCSKIYSL